MVNKESKGSNEYQGSYVNKKTVEEYEEAARAKAEKRHEAKRKATFERSVNWVLLIASVAGMVYMILNQLIDQKIGLFALAFASVCFGRGTK